MRWPLIFKLSCLGGCGYGVREPRDVEGREMYTQLRKCSTGDPQLVKKSFLTSAPGVAVHVLTETAFVELSQRILHSTPVRSLQLHTADCLVPVEQNWHPQNTVTRPFITEHGTANASEQPRAGSRAVAVAALELQAYQRNVQRISPGNDVFPGAACSVLWAAPCGARQGGVDTSAKTATEAVYVAPVTIAPSASVPWGTSPLRSPCAAASSLGSGNDGHRLRLITSEDVAAVLTSLAATDPSFMPEVYDTTARCALLGQHCSVRYLVPRHQGGGVSGIGCGGVDGGGVGGVGVHQRPGSLELAALSAIQISTCWLDKGAGRAPVPGLLVVLVGTRELGSTGTCGAGDVLRSRRIIGGSGESRDRQLARGSAALPRPIRQIPVRAATSDLRLGNPTGSAAPTAASGSYSVNLTRHISPDNRQRASSQPQSPLPKLSCSGDGSGGDGDGGGGDVVGRAGLDAWVGLTMDALPDCVMAFECRNDAAAQSPARTAFMCRPTRVIYLSPRARGYMGCDGEVALDDLLALPLLGQMFSREPEQLEAMLSEAGSSEAGFSAIVAVPAWIDAAATTAAAAAVAVRTPQYASASFSTGWASHARTTALRMLRPQSALGDQPRLSLYSAGTAAAAGAAGAQSTIADWATNDSSAMQLSSTVAGIRCEANDPECGSIRWAGLLARAVGCSEANGGGGGGNGNGNSGSCDAPDGPDAVNMRCVLSSQMLPLCSQLSAVRCLASPDVKLPRHLRTLGGGLGSPLSRASDRGASTTVASPTTATASSSGIHIRDQPHYHQHRGGPDVGDLDGQPPLAVAGWNVRQQCDGRGSAATTTPASLSMGASSCGQSLPGVQSGPPCAAPLPCSVTGYAARRVKPAAAPRISMSESVAAAVAAGAAPLAVTSKGASRWWLAGATAVPRPHSRHAPVRRVTSMAFLTPFRPAWSHGTQHSSGASGYEGGQSCEVDLSSGAPRPQPQSQPNGPIRSLLERLQRPQPNGPMQISPLQQPPSNGPMVQEVSSSLQHRRNLSDALGSTSGFGGTGCSSDACIMEEGGPVAGGDKRPVPGLPHAGLHSPAQQLMREDGQVPRAYERKRQTAGQDPLVGVAAADNGKRDSNGDTRCTEQKGTQPPGSCRRADTAGEGGANAGVSREAHLSQHVKAVRPKIYSRNHSFSVSDAATSSAPAALTPVHWVLDQLQQRQQPHQQQQRQQQPVTSLSGASCSVTKTRYGGLSLMLHKQALLSRSAPGGGGGDDSLPDGTLLAAAMSSDSGSGVDANEIPSNNQQQHQVPSNSQQQHEVPSNSQQQHQVPSNSQQQHQVPSNSQQQHVKNPYGDSMTPVLGILPAMVDEPKTHLEAAVAVKVKMSGTTVEHAAAVKVVAAASDVVRAGAPGCGSRSSLYTSTTLCQPEDPMSSSLGASAPSAATSRRAASLGSLNSSRGISAIDLTADLSRAHARQPERALQTNPNTTVAAATAGAPAGQLPAARRVRRQACSVRHRVRVLLDQVEAEEEEEGEGLPPGSGPGLQQLLQQCEEQGHHAAMHRRASSAMYGTYGPQRELQVPCSSQTSYSGSPCDLHFWASSPFVGLSVPRLSSAQSSALLSSCATPAIRWSPEHDKRPEGQGSPSAPEWPLPQLPQLQPSAPNLRPHRLPAQALSASLTTPSSHPQQGRLFQNLPLLHNQEHQDQQGLMAPRDSVDSDPHGVLLSTAPAICGWPGRASTVVSSAQAPRPSARACARASGSIGTFSGHLQRTLNRFRGGGFLDSILSGASFIAEGNGSGAGGNNERNPHESDASEAGFLSSSGSGGVVVVGGGGDGGGSFGLGTSHALDSGGQGNMCFTPFHLLLSDNSLPASELATAAGAGSTQPSSATLAMSTVPMGRDLNSRELGRRSGSAAAAFAAAFFGPSRRASRTASRSIVPAQDTSRRCSWLMNTDTGAGPATEGDPRGQTLYPVPILAGPPSYSGSRAAIGSPLSQSGSRIATALLLRAASRSRAFLQRRQAPNPASDVVGPSAGAVGGRDATTMARQSAGAGGPELGRHNAGDGDGVVEAVQWGSGFCVAQEEQVELYGATTAAPGPQVEVWEQGLGPALEGQSAFKEEAVHTPTQQESHDTAGGDASCGGQLGAVAERAALMTSGAAASLPAASAWGFSGSIRGNTPLRSTSSISNAVAAALGTVPTAHYQIQARRRVDPGSGKQVLVLCMHDVTAAVQRRERALRLLLQEHKVLESLFPRHILTFLALNPSALGTQDESNGSSGGGSGARYIPTASIGDDDDPNTMLLLRAPTSAAPRHLNAVRRMVAAQQMAMTRVSQLATRHRIVTILFTDCVGFTNMCRQIDPKLVMHFLNELYSRCDALLDVHKVAKIETIGDAYVVAGGLIRYDDDGFRCVLPEGETDELHAAQVLTFAQAMLRASRGLTMPHTGEPMQLRLGMHSGPVMSGVVGTKQPRFTVFGETVEVAKRMESGGTAGRILVSPTTRDLLIAARKSGGGGEGTGGAVSGAGGGGYRWEAVDSLSRAAAQHGQVAGTAAPAAGSASPSAPAAGYLLVENDEESAEVL